MDREQVFKTPKSLRSVYLTGLHASKKSLKLWGKSWRNQSGLTLLEMAIVLIVVGVFLAGVIPKGRAILEQARLKKTLMELHQHHVVVSEFLDNNTHIDRSSEDGNSVWNQLQSEGTLPPQNLQKDTQSACPKLSNGGFLTIKFKDGRCWMIFGKKGRGIQRVGFMTLHQALFLKTGLGFSGIEIINDDEKIVGEGGLESGIGSVQNDAKSTDLYGLQIPVD